jgi:hypothetical protein
VVQRQKQQRQKSVAKQEEESMTQYSAQDLDGFEFKIVRSVMGRFSNYEAVQKLCAEEARAGWEMVEKFDNDRIRFKRRIERRNQDKSLSFDPYRTSVGIAELGVAAIVIGCIAAVVVVALLFLR